MVAIANLLVSVPTRSVELLLILISAPLSSNFGLFVSMAGEIFLRFWIRFKESKEIWGLSSLVGKFG